MFRFFSIAVLCLASVSFFTGCSDKVSVSGKVTYTDGENVGGGMVTFSSETQTYKGTINKETSKFVLGAGGDGKGITKGTYAVTLAYTNPASRQIFIPLKYSRKDTSGLTCEVTGATTFDITVERPTAREMEKKPEREH
ncbi:hypothetical protein FACS189454_02070 [Planctomycetales bacterium]|nr:hypothetical protein FACS189443_6690 [Planctomycetales bacterium]GHT44500.1 hypothetical protein FACS189454_02070 [Planctomycetales bacterium]